VDGFLDALDQQYRSGGLQLLQRPWLPLDEDDVTNLLVMGPGGYMFRDYLKIGLFINLLLWIAATILIPVFWPLGGGM
jgi:hypothetical protein